MQRLLETLILYLALTIFAIYGVFWLAPAIGQGLSQVLVNAANAGNTKAGL